MRVTLLLVLRFSSASSFCRITTKDSINNNTINAKEPVNQPMVLFMDFMSIYLVQSRVCVNIKHQSGNFLGYPGKRERYLLHAIFRNLLLNQVVSQRKTESCMYLKLAIVKIETSYSHGA